MLVRSSQCCGDERPRKLLEDKFARARARFYCRTSHDDEGRRVYIGGDQNRDGQEVASFQAGCR